MRDLLARRRRPANGTSRAGAPAEVRPDASPPFGAVCRGLPPLVRNWSVRGPSMSAVARRDPRPTAGEQPFGRHHRWLQDTRVERNPGTSGGPYRACGLPLFIRSSCRVSSRINAAQSRFCLMVRRSPRVQESTRSSTRRACRRCRDCRVTSTDSARRCHETPASTRRAMALVSSSATAERISSIWRSASGSGASTIRRAAAASRAAFNECARAIRIRSASSTIPPPEICQHDTDATSPRVTALGSSLEAGRRCDWEVSTVKAIARELGRTVRAAIRGWPETTRLCVILLVAAILVAATL